MGATAGVEDVVAQSMESLKESAKEYIASSSSADIARCRQRFNEDGFTQLLNVLNPAVLREMCDGLSKQFSSHFYHVERRIRPDLTLQATGYCLRRAYFDPQDAGDYLAPAWAACMAELRTGAAALASVLAPLVQEIIGQYHYHSGSMFLYHEGDFAGVHNDDEGGSRVNVQFPMPINAVGCIRILIREQLKVFYDVPGCMNILGPRVWHDVPPLLRLPGQAPPQRLNLTLRFVDS